MTEQLAGWASASVAEVAEAVRGLTYKKEQARSQAGNGLAPLLRATNVQDGHLLLEDHLYFIPETLVREDQWLRPGDIVLASSSGSSSVVGKSAAMLRPWRGTFGAFCTVLRPSKHVDPLFLAHFVASPSVRSRWSALAAGTNINNLKAAHIGGTEIPLPPLSEQRRIVAAIEEQFSRLDAARVSLQRVELRSAALRRSILHTALAPLDRIRRLGDVAETQLGKMLSAKARTGVGARPYLRNKNVQWGRIDLGDVLEMDFSERDAQKFSLQLGDVLVCEGGEVGRSAIWRGGIEGCCYQKALHRVRVGDDLLSEYLVHVMRWIADREAFDPYVTGSTIKHLPQEDLRLIPIPAPTIAEQQRIVATVEEQLSLVDATLAAVESAKRRSAALRRSILERAFRGELVPQDPSDEPASVLLERIAAERAAAEEATGRRPRRRETVQGS